MPARDQLKLVREETIIMCALRIESGASLISNPDKARAYRECADMLRRVAALESYRPYARPQVSPNSDAFASDIEEGI